MKPYFAIIVLLVVASVSVAGGLDIGVVTDIDAAGKRLTVVLENDGAITFGKKRGRDSIRRRVSMSQVPKQFAADMKAIVNPVSGAAFSMYFYINQKELQNCGLNLMDVLPKEVQEDFDLVEKIANNRRIDSTNFNGAVLYWPGSAKVIYTKPIPAP